MDALIRALQEAMGVDQVSVDPVELAARSGDGRGSGGVAGALVRPRTPDEVATVVRLATHHGVTVVPQGARTGLVGGSSPDETGEMILIGLDRLVGTLTIDPVNRTADAAAGILLSTLNAAAAEHGLVFPVDLGADPTVGGMVSANTGGARFLRYGDVRRNLLGLEVVLADAGATRLALGGALWKDNSGLDLKQMIVGAGGAMGVVTRATLALQPLPASSVTAMVALRDARVTEAMLRALERRCGTLLTAFEGMSPAAYGAALAHLPRLRSPFPADAGAYYLLIELSAGCALEPEKLEEILADAMSAWMDVGGAVVDVAIDRGDGLWAIRHAIPEGLRALGTVVGCDIALRRGDVSAFRESVGAEIADAFPGLLLCDFGHVGDGGLHFNMVWPRSEGPPSPDLLEGARAHVFAAAVERFGGSYSAEHGIGPRNMPYYERWAGADKLRLAGRLQAVFAPRPIGRVDFGSIRQENVHVR